MQDYKLATTPMEKGLKLSTKSSSPIENESEFRQLVGNLIYLTATRPDLSFAVSYISRFMTAPTSYHWATAKRILRYVKGTSNFDIKAGQWDFIKFGESQKILNLFLLGIFLIFRFFINRWRFC